MKNKTFIISDQNKLPVDNKCCLNNVIYQAKVFKSQDDHKVYIGSTKRSFKSRYNEHKTSFIKPFKKKTKKLYPTCKLPMELIK